MALGKSHCESFVTLSFEEIYKICEYDIKNAYFTSLGNILKQIRGVPMGSPGSPNFAITICSYYEHLLHQKLKRFRFKNHYYDCTNIIKALRYIDDLLVILAFDKNDNKSKEILNQIILTIEKETYHKFMKLKPEDTKKPFTFLQTIIILSNNDSVPWFFKPTNFGPRGFKNKVSKLL